MNKRKRFGNKDIRQNSHVRVVVDYPDSVLDRLKQQILYSEALQSEPARRMEFSGQTPSLPSPTIEVSEECSSTYSCQTPLQSCEAVSFKFFPNYLSLQRDAVKINCRVTEAMEFEQKQWRKCLTPCRQPSHHQMHLAIKIQAYAQLMQLKFGHWHRAHS